MNLLGSFEVECFQLLQIIFNRPLMTKCISFYIVIRQMRQKVSFVSPLKTSAFNSHQSSVSKRISRSIQIFNSQVSIPFMPIISVHKTIDLFESRVSVSVLKMLWREKLVTSAVTTTTGGEIARFRHQRIFSLVER